MDNVTKKTFTALAIERLRPPSKGRVEIGDVAVPGLCMRVTENGVKSWSIIYRVSGEGGLNRNGYMLKGPQKRLTLGIWPIIDLTTAREQARNALRIASEGSDPIESRRQEVSQRISNSVESVVDRFIELYAKPNTRNWLATKRMLEMHVLSEWGVHLIKPYCALKWLILENPPHSRDKEDAWRLVNDTVAAPLFELGLKHKESQRGRAKHERGKVNEEGKTINQLIGSLCLKPTYKDKPAVSLWSDFIVRLDDELLDPKEIQHLTDSRKLSVEYNFKGGRKIISLGQFSNVVSDYRTGKKIILARLT